jgi:hypothetical protein
LCPAIRLNLFLAKEARKRIPLLSGLKVLHHYSAFKVFHKTPETKEVTFEK